MWCQPVEISNLDISQMPEAVRSHHDAGDESALCLCDNRSSVIRDVQRKRVLLIKRMALHLGSARVAVVCNRGQLRSPAGSVHSHVEAPGDEFREFRNAGIEIDTYG